MAVLFTLKKNGELDKCEVKETPMQIWDKWYTERESRNFDMLLTLPDGSAGIFQKRYIFRILDSVNIKLRVERPDDFDPFNRLDNEDG